MPSAKKNSIDVTVRGMRPDQKDAIRALLLKAFDSPLEAELVDRLLTRQRTSGEFEFAMLPLVALRRSDDLPIGMLGLSGAFIDGRDELRGLAIAPVAVLPEFQRMGVGSALMRDAVKLVAKGLYSFAMLLGDPAYYARFGFEPACKYGLEGEFGGGDAFMILIGEKAHLPPRGTLLRYHPVFREVFGGEDDG